jgi:hypothetical protein
MKMVGIKVHFLEKMQPNTAPSGPVGTGRVFRPLGVTTLAIDRLLWTLRDFTQKLITPILVILLTAKNIILRRSRLQAFLHTIHHKTNRPWENHAP